MENVIVACFDTTVFSSRTLSDLASFNSIKAQVIYRDAPRLTTAHLALRVPIVLATAANIRKYIKAGVFPKVDAIYYDPYTRYFHATQSAQANSFAEIINREPTDVELVKFFKRQHNIARQHYTKVPTHAHQPRARQLDTEEDEDTFDEDPFEIISLNDELPPLPKPQRPELTRTKTRNENGLDTERRSPFLMFGSEELKTSNTFLSEPFGLNQLKGVPDNRKMEPKRKFYRGLEIDTRDGYDV